MKYRHEDKYLCSNQELGIIYQKLKHIAQLDSHVNAGEKSYLIRSIYFDDLYNSAFFDNESGAEPREKWRIRAYNCDDSRITLECKRKEHGMVSKQSCLLGKEEFAAIMGGKKMKPENKKNKILNRFLMLREMAGLHPCVLIQYQRYPFVYSHGNVRITFDCNLSSSRNVEEFFGSNAQRRCILPHGQQLLEVKYDEYLPDCLYHAIQLANMQKITFSKYFLCRTYSI